MECNSKGVARRRCGHLEDLARDRIAAALERVVVRDAARALVWWERERGGGGQGCSRVARAFETASHARVSVVRVTCCTGCRWRRSCGI
jgi:hypothetical protein